MNKQLKDEISNQREVVLQFLKLHPNYTSKELADKMNAERVIPARRLPELEDQGLVERGARRRCRLGNRLSFTWSAS